ncbi:DUF2125 domain-containing protein [Tropicimonas aquimaris]|uniref:DUF2125 domain-containing protein n=1 Tax=Tropicimonas aquimaris TaxID=914152 RepID=A0ABW3IVN2_9RHOB
MKQWILGGVSAAALFAAPDAGWSLTAQQAWEDWKAATESYGQTLTTSGEAMMDGTLTLSGVTVASKSDDMTVEGTIEEVALAEQSDGSVRITMSETIPIVVSGIDEVGDKVDLTLMLTQDGTQITASDADGGTAFAVASPTMSAEVTELMINDEALPMQLVMTLAGLDGSYSTTGAAPGTIESAFTATSFDIVLDMQDPEGAGTMALKATAQDIATSTSGQNMDLSNSDDMAKMLAEGFATSGEGTYGPVTFTMDLQDEAETVQASGSLTGGQARFSLDAERMVYDVAYEGADLTISGSQIPMPQVTAKIDRSATTFEIPVQQSDAPAPFALRVALENLSLGEEIWSMFDPAAVLPRDPATLILDLGGKARWLVDIFDEEAMMAAAMPGEVEEVALNELRLDLGGAELTGDGAFTFDNSDLTTFDGMPRPEGKANLKLVGGNALLENLTRMGLIPQEQVMMVRMMTGMFARPGAGPDELVSEIAIDGSGTLTINGAPLPF